MQIRKLVENFLIRIHLKLKIKSRKRQASMVLANSDQSDLDENEVITNDTFQVINTKMNSNNSPVDGSDMNSHSPATMCSKLTQKPPTPEVMRDSNF